jgi:hypothetical protein
MMSDSAAIIGFTNFLILYDRTLNEHLPHNMNPGRLLIKRTYVVFSYIDRNLFIEIIAWSRTNILTKCDI